MTDVLLPTAAEQPMDEEAAAVAAAALEAMEEDEPAPGPADAAAAALRKAIFAIMNDASLSEEEKVKQRQQLMMGNWNLKAQAAEEPKAAAGKADKKKDKGHSKVAAVSIAPAAAGPSKAGGMASALNKDLNCVICMNLCERPITTPCQHNFCLACFRKWTAMSNSTCPSCRAPFSRSFAQNTRINTSLVAAIRLAKEQEAKGSKAVPGQGSASFVRHDDRPDEAFVTERAQRKGMANAASGKLKMDVPSTHFGPILPEHDKEHGRGVLVGDWWADRMSCRMSCVHLPHVAGIAGQSDIGAQSVVLSGGYLDDQDEGEWFLYTGSGGRDLSGNKRTNKVQSFDQKFELSNKALLESCLQGLPVRVVRSFKEKRSQYAPSTDTPVRYDGVYRILRCWRKKGLQKHLICRYLFMRCDNSPAPWSSDESCDPVRLDIPKEADAEIKAAVGRVYEMTDQPYWDWQADKATWGWVKPQPQALVDAKGSRVSKVYDPLAGVKSRIKEHTKALNELKCSLCKDVLTQPVTTPCGHNFCKGCLDGKFAGVADIEAPNAARSLRIRKVKKPCPCCKADICDFLCTAQVNRSLVEVIATIQAALAPLEADLARMTAELAAGGDAGAGSSGSDDMGDQEQQQEECQEEEEQQGEDDDKGEESEEEAAEQKASKVSKVQKKRKTTRAEAASPKPDTAQVVIVAAAAVEAGLSEAQPGGDDDDDEECDKAVTVQVKAVSKAAGRGGKADAAGGSKGETAKPVSKVSKPITEASTAKASTAKATAAKASTAKAPAGKASTAKASAAKATAAKASTAKASAAKATGQRKAQQQDEMEVEEEEVQSEGGSSDDDESSSSSSESDASSLDLGSDDQDSSDEAEDDSSDGGFRPAAGARRRGAAPAKRKRGAGGRAGVGRKGRKAASSEDEEDASSSEPEQSDEQEEEAPPPKRSKAAASKPAATKSSSAKKPAAKKPTTSAKPAGRATGRKVAAK